MDRIILIKYGELSTKKGNRNFFINTLYNNVKNKLRDYNVNISKDRSRMYISFMDDDLDKIKKVIDNIFGIHMYHIAYIVDTNDEIIQKKVLEVMNNTNFKTFKIETKRCDKSFSIHSQEYNHVLGCLILKNINNISVDVHNPDVLLRVEIREKHSYIYSNAYKGAGGYPVGSQPKGLLMLSGGIDSPVAGYLAMKRGIKLDAIYFEAIPHTSLDARQKVIDLSKELVKFTDNINLHVVNFTKIQEEIYKKCNPTYCITIMRRMMYRIAEGVAKKNKALAIINGESIGQVASQTLTSMSVINSVTNMHGTFDGCRNLIGNIYIQSNRVTNAMRCFNSTTLTKNIYIPFAYENSEYTPTYNSFIAAGYDELGTQHGVYLKDINLLPSTVTLTVNTTPVDATVTFNTGTISGHSVTVPYNTEVSYTVSKEGYKTSETYTHTVTQDETINAPELEPDEPEVELLLDDETKILPAGTYKYICIGGGASGQNAINSSRSVTTTQTRLSGGTGGMGGGSGYITYGDFTLDEDTEISFTVGKGGVQTSTFGSGAPIAGGASTITKVSDSSVLGTASGGIINSSMVGVKSSSGGSGGAAQSGMYANYQLNGYSSRGPSDGHNGGIGGGNGQPHAYQTDEDAAVWVKESGKGYYNTVKSYANNAGVKGSPGTSGGGGIGVSAVQDIITVDFINNMDDTKLQTLYNSIGGGGSGGAATVYDTDTIAGSGGAGGGGGGWFAGEDGAIKSDITTRQATGGNGGDGAILYIKAS